MYKATAMFGGKSSLPRRYCSTIVGITDVALVPYSASSINAASFSCCSPYRILIFNSLRFNGEGESLMPITLVETVEQHFSRYPVRRHTQLQERHTQYCCHTLQRCALRPPGE